MRINVMPLSWNAFRLLELQLGQLWMVLSEFWDFTMWNVLDREFRKFLYNTF